eukprot:CAMPEP_0168424936 /NCGR_PEP_ID=MMETSP0228-20121227/35072_1 /TAXON_ID=133427 /ORGANISM="Protoceratium reticulatum, Strain CCCM 535 (=CCMP 1889)" /LENGTH=71 /DNA_ID=CAMNT_0008438927 /DNA_START=17 /DNA_END=228 /DNA_ORIENTATION=-
MTEVHLRRGLGHACRVKTPVPQVGPDDEGKVHISCCAKYTADNVLHQGLGLVGIHCHLDGHHQEQARQLKA